MLLADLKYASLVGPRLLRYRVRRQSPFIATARCPSCGDSKKSKIKTRFYIYEDRGDVWTKCHNCGEANSFRGFLKRFDPALYGEYALECLTGSDSLKPLASLPDPARVKREIGLPRIDQLPDDHVAVKYLRDRRLPEESLARLYFAERFVAYSNAFVPDKFDEKMEGPRIIIPFIDKNGEFFGYQGRSLDPRGIRYVSVMLDYSRPKVFGADRIDPTKRVWVFEGPFDSLFFPNALAMAGADLDIDLDDKVFVYDNEPRNPEIVARIECVIEENKEVVIWPNEFRWKDVNDSVLDGMSPEWIRRIAERGLCRGIEARLRLMSWRRC